MIPRRPAPAYAERNRRCTARRHRRRRARFGFLACAGVSNGCATAAPRDRDRDGLIARPPRSQFQLSDDEDDRRVIGSVVTPARFLEGWRQRARIAVPPALTPAIALLRFLPWPRLSVGTWDGAGGVARGRGWRRSRSRSAAWRSRSRWFARIRRCTGTTRTAGSPSATSWSSGAGCRRCSWWSTPSAR